MSDFEHNIVSLLYALKSTLESHLQRVEENGFPQAQERVLHAEEALRRAYLQSDKVLEMLKKLVRLGQREHSMKKARSRVSIRCAWSEVIKLLQKEFDFASLDVIERIPEHFPPLQCDRDAFKEILYHLAKNAIQAMKNEGKLILRAQIALSLQEEPFVMISLSDTGSGIAQDELPQLFRPFFTTKPESEGNGLGLYLTRQLILKNKGKITVSSFEGCGTTFTLEFPLPAHLSNKNLTAS